MTTFSIFNSPISKFAFIVEFLVNFEILMWFNLMGISYFFIRMTKLLDEELEDDEAFWNQEALKEVKMHSFCLGF